MKKFLGILFLLIVIAIGVAAYFFPGIPYYYKCTHEFKLMDSIISDLPTDLPPVSDEPADYSALGIKLTAWEDMEPVRTDDKNSSIWENEDRSHFISVYAESLGSNYDFLDRTGISHEDLDRYCKKMEKTTPETLPEFVKLVCSLTMEDFDIHDSKNAKTFYRMMDIKNKEYIDDIHQINFYTADGVGYRGYLKTANAPAGDYALINIYPDKDKQKRYIIEMSVTDWNEVKAVTESIKLTE